MGLAPTPQVPERAGVSYQREIAPGTPGNRGPLRFEEGIATDTDVPKDFHRGITEAAIPAPGRDNHVNPNLLFKHADETMSERAHVGSASWVDAPTYLSEFAHEAFGGAEQKYVQVNRGGGRHERKGPAVVND